MNHNDQWLKEPVSDDLKNKIFAQVQPELEDNKRRYEASQATDSAEVSLFNWWKALSFSVIAVAFAGMFYLRSINVIDVDYPTTTFGELASLTPEEFEVIENLDFIDDLDKINLDEVRKEMKQKKTRGKKS